MRNAYVRNSVRKDRLTSDEILMLILMQEFRRKGKEDTEFPMTCSFTIDMVVSEFNIDTRRNVEGLIGAYTSLIDKKYIIELRKNEKITRHTYLSARIAFANKKEYYNNVDLKLIDVILESDKSIKEKKAMIYLLVLLISYRGSNKYAFPTIECLIEDSGMSKSSVHSAKDELSKLGIIIYSNNGAKINKSTGEIKKDNNKYIITEKHTI